MAPHLQAPPIRRFSHRASPALTSPYHKFVRNVACIFGKQDNDTYFRLNFFDLQCSRVSNVMVNNQFVASSSLTFSTVVDILTAWGNAQYLKNEYIR